MAQGIKNKELNRIPSDGAFAEYVGRKMLETPPDERSRMLLGIDNWRDAFNEGWRACFEQILAAHPRLALSPKAKARDPNKPKRTWPVCGICHAPINTKAHKECKRRRAAVTSTAGGSEGQATA